jgi:hypothetical protein
MRNFAFLILSILLFFSCNRATVQYQSTAQFQKMIVRKKLAITKIDLQISYDTLFNWLGMKPGRILFNSSQEKSDLPIQIIQEGEIKVRIISANELELKLPISWEAEPKLSGFSAGKVKAKMLLTVKSKIDLSNFKTLKFLDTDFTYQWLEKPSLKVMGFGINVTGVMDQLIQSQKNKILATLTSYGNEKMKFDFWENRLNKELKPLIFEDFIFHNYQTTIDLDQLKFSPNGIMGLLKIKSHIEITDKFNGKVDRGLSPIKFGKVTSDSLSKLAFHLNLSYSYLEKIFSQSLAYELKNPKVNLIFVQADSGHIGVQLRAFKGLDSKMDIAIVPVVFTNNKLGMKVVNLEISNLNFPSILFKNLISRRITKQINAYSYDLNDRIQSIIKRNELIQYKGYNLNLGDLNWNSHSINLNGYVLGEYILKK